MEYTDELGAWWESLTEDEQESVAFSIGLLESQGVTLEHQVADLLEKSQATISALEKREDMLLSTLAQYVRVVGGELEIRARFPGRPDVIVRQLSNVRTSFSEVARADNRCYRS